ncbi:hypothetical protein PAXRUDRAFT_21046 [Paxillus rubicundulus Ve08.2h10]|uniref:HAT C-terminal dimerisation domain-containing protein n=1 Tax=Paxillus rubicundulus Ve08.2h10 TaxID=930991 RepID=A0A0D0BP06_9AGAM|nr:hypothetical protein PAXRUDRAFT_21046 [Paxillus rubicundulus Ve08.2h10]
MATQGLNCLTHVFNLGITDVMSVITNIATVETTTVIWEFDPALPSNQILDGSLNVVAAICTIAIKIQASWQHIAYFECIQAKCSIEHAPLTIPLHSNICWGTADGMLAHSYLLWQPINLFQIFLHNTQPTLWKAIPAFEELQSAWEAKMSMLLYAQCYKGALEHSLAKIRKYYTKFDEKPVYVLALILHPYYKLAYIKMAWGGPEEQQKEHEAGQTNAKDWQDEALQIVEHTMEEYWKSGKLDQLNNTPTTHATSAAFTNTVTATPSTLQLEFDHHHLALIRNSECENSGTWKAELGQYLEDIPQDVSKTMDIVQWWAEHKVTKTMIGQ